MTKEEIVAPGRRGREAGQAATARTSSSRPRTPPAPSSTSSPRSSRRPSRPAPRRVNIPDTVGYAMPEPVRRRHPAPRRSTSAASTRRSSASTATTTWAWPSPTAWPPCEDGARQVECTINGIGERAGNAALEEIVMALQHPAATSTACTTGINTQRLYPTSRLVSHVTGMHVQRNKAIVGQNAFAHEAGIHQDGMLKERATYEIMQPEDVGIPQTDLVLGKHSRPARPASSGSTTWATTSTTSSCNSVFEEFKALADKKKEIYDADIEALAENQLHSRRRQLWTLVGFTCNGRHRRRSPSAAVALWHQDGTIVQRRRPSATARSTRSSRRSSASPASR